MNQSTHTNLKRPSRANETECLQELERLKALHQNVAIVDATLDDQDEIVLSIYSDPTYPRDRLVRLLETSDLAETVVANGGRWACFARKKSQD